MKGRITALALASLLLGGIVPGLAFPGPMDRPEPGCGGPSERASFPPRLARILELSDGQRERIRAIFKEELAKGQALQEKAAELRQRLDAAEWDGAFDEKTVRNTANDFAAVQADIFVSRIKAHFRINEVLTAAQKALAEKLRPERDGCLLPPGCGEHEGRRHPRPGGDEDGR